MSQRHKFSPVGRTHLAEAEVVNVEDIGETSVSYKHCQRHWRGNFYRSGQKPKLTNVELNIYYWTKIC